LSRLCWCYHQQKVPLNAVGDNTNSGGHQERRNFHLTPALSKGEGDVEMYLINAVGDNTNSGGATLTMAE